MFIFVQFMHCLIFMKRGGKMEQETEKKSNRKIHIIFAIFTLILSFGISFVDVNADVVYPSYEGEFQIDEKSYNEYLQSYPYCIKTYSYSREYEMQIEYTAYYFSKSPLYWSRGSTSTVQDLKSENNDDILVISRSLIWFKGKYSTDELTDKVYHGFVFTKNFSVISSFNDSVIHGNYNFENLKLTPEDFPVPPVASVATTLPEVVTVNSQVIIGGTICFLALMIFLVALVKHLRAVSQGY